jgi:PAS domain S-box-containing protein
LAIRFLRATEPESLALCLVDAKSCESSTVASPGLDRHGCRIVKQQDKPTSPSLLRSGSDPSSLAAQSGVLRYFLAALTLVLGLIVAGAVYQTVRQNEQLRHERNYESLVTQRVRSVHKTMSAYMQNVIAVHALFGASDFVSRDEFRRFVEPLLEEESGIQAFEWIPRVRESDEAAYREAARADGYDFHIVPVGDGARPPRTTLADAYPVFYLEPRESNESALGMDLGSEYARAEAIERARDSAQSTATTPLRLVQDEVQAKSTIIFVPRYRNDPSGKDLAWRQQNLVGFVSVVVRLPDLLQDALADLSPRFVNVSLYYEDEFVAGPEPDPGADTSRTSASQRRLVRTETIEMGGRQWSVRSAPTPLFLSSRNTTRPLLALLAGLALTLLATAYLYISTRSAEIGRALSQSELRYRRLVETAPEAILTINVERQHFVDANPTACTLFGFSRDEFLRRWVTDISPPTQPDGRPSSEGAQQYIQQALDGGIPTFVWVHRDRKGREFPCEVRLVRLPGSDGPVVRGSLTDITERVRGEERQMLMMRELDHRVKNNLATVLSLTEQSAPGTDSVDELRSSLASRIRAIADLYSALASKQWADMDLSEVWELTFAPYNRRAEIDRIHCSGPPCTVSPDTASAICMVGHELATNAVKYGALSQAGGRVDIAWKLGPDGIAIDWTESGGPETREPTRTGYGSRLITGLVEHQLGGRVETTYLPVGLRCRMFIPPSVLGPPAYRT